MFPTLYILASAGHIIIMCSPAFLEGIEDLNGGAKVRKMSLCKRVNRI